MKKRGISVVVGVICLVLVLATLPLATACPSASSPEPGEHPQNVQLTLMGFVAGTSMQLRIDAVAEAIRVEYPDWTVTSLATKGSADNTSRRIAGEVDFYMSLLPRNVEIQSHAPLYPDIDFEAATVYSVVMPTSRHYVHCFALGKTGLNSIEDIVEQKYPITIGYLGSCEFVFHRILEYYGASWAEAEAWGARSEPVSVGSPAGPEALQAGSIDTAFIWTGMPNPPYMGVTFDLKLLPIDDPGLVDMFKELGFYEVTIPAGAYPFVTEDIPTMGDTEFLVVRPDIPEDIVYYTVKALFNHKDILIAANTEFESQMAPEAVAASLAQIEQTGLPVHAGALKFYREMGWVE